LEEDGGYGSTPVQANSWETPISKNNESKMGWWYGLSGRVPGFQVGTPISNPDKKKKRKEKK
jgi:hypothetical protein